MLFADLSGTLGAASGCRSHAEWRSVAPAAGLTGDECQMNLRSPFLKTHFPHILFPFSLRIICSDHAVRRWFSPLHATEIRILLSRFIHPERPLPRIRPSRVASTGVDTVDRTPVGESHRLLGSESKTGEPGSRGALCRPRGPGLVRASAETLITSNTLRCRRR